MSHNGPSLPLTLAFNVTIALYGIKNPFLLYFLLGNKPDRTKLNFSCIMMHMVILETNALSMQFYMWQGVQCTPKEKEKTKDFAMVGVLHLKSRAVFLD